MNKNLLVVTLAVLVAALVTVTVVYAAYPSGIGGMMNQQRNGYNGGYGQMTEEQCETQMQNMHGSDFGSSMMEGYDHDAMHNGMMNFNDTTSLPSGMMGRGGCH